MVVAVRVAPQAVPAVVPVRAGRAAPDPAVLPVDGRVVGLRPIGGEDGRAGIRRRGLGDRLEVLVVLVRGALGARDGPCEIQIALRSTRLRSALARQRSSERPQSEPVVADVWVLTERLARRRTKPLSSGSTRVRFAPRPWLQWNGLNRGVSDRRNSTLRLLNASARWSHQHSERRACVSV